MAGVGSAVTLQSPTSIGKYYLSLVCAGVSFGSKADMAVAAGRGEDWYEDQECSL